MNREIDRKIFSIVVSLKTYPLTFIHFSAVANKRYNYTIKTYFGRYFKYFLLNISDSNILMTVFLDVSLKQLASAHSWLNVINLFYQYNRVLQANISLWIHEYWIFYFILSTILNRRRFHMDNPFISSQCHTYSIKQLCKED